jgi:hypothetical protein
MSIRWRRDLVAWSFVCATALVVTGCHKDSVPASSSSPSPSPSGSSNPSATPTGSGGIQAQTTFTLNSTAGGSPTLSSSGLSGTLSYPSSSGATNVSAQYTLTTNPPALSFAPPGTPIVYGELVLGASVQFSNYFGFTNVTIPTSIASLSSTNTVYETLYDGNSGAQLGSTVSLTPNGQSFTFTGFVGSGPFSATAFDTYYLVISYQ